MSLFSPTSLFKESNFRIQFKQDLPAIEVMVNNVQLPSVTIDALEIPRPGLKDKRPGQHINYSDLTVNVICDEKLEVYKEIYNYLLNTSNPNTANYQVDYPVFDATLYLTTNKNNIQHIIRFYDAFFTSISNITLQSSTTEDTHVTFTLTLVFTYFNFE